jgi:outer membrane immunogenic protein
MRLNGRHTAVRSRTNPTFNLLIASGSFIGRTAAQGGLHAFFIGGGQVGCDFQAGSSRVFGVQGQFDFGNINGRHAPTDFPAFSETNSLREIYTATGRIGYLFTPAFLAYGKVGMAFLPDRNQVFAPGGALAESASFTLPGITAGGGVEWMFAPNWSVFAEYNYIWFYQDDLAQHFNPTPGFVGEVINTNNSKPRHRPGLFIARVSLLVRQARRSRDLMRL